MLLNILLHFLLQKFFPYIPPLKHRCILWSGASYSPKNMVIASWALFLGSRCVLSIAGGGSDPLEQGT